MINGNGREDKRNLWQRKTRESREKSVLSSDLITMDPTGVYTVETGTRDSSRRERTLSPLPRRRLSTMVSEKCLNLTSWTCRKTEMITPGHIWMMAVVHDRNQFIYVPATYRRGRLHVEVSCLIHLIDKWITCCRNPSCPNCVIF